MSDEPLLTLRQLSEELKLPESTVRYYRDAFLDHIPSVGTGRRRRYPAAATAVLRSIAKSYAAGRSRAEIIAAIGGNGTVPPTIAVTAEAPSRAVPLEEVSNLDLLAAILDGERDQRDALWQMAKEIVRLTEVLEGQDKVLNEIADRAGVLVSLPSGSRGSAAPMPRLAPAEPAPAAPPVAPAAAAPRADEPSIASTFFSARPAPATPPATPPIAVAEPLDDAVEVVTIVEPAAVEGDSAPAPTPRSGADASDMDRLREELETERALVERLRESKLQLEHRAADAEAELEDRGKRRPSVLRRLLGSQPE